MSSKLELDFLEFLKECGYPADSLLHEPVVKDKNRDVIYFDFGIIDPELNELIALIEIKESFERGSKVFIEQTKRIRKEPGLEITPLYLVTSSNEYVAEFPFDIFSIDKEFNLVKIDYRLFPKFGALAASAISSKKEDISQKGKDLIDSFSLTARIAAVILILVVASDFVLSFRGIQLLTVERMSLIGAAVALLIIPYSQKFKGLGIEWTRARPKK